MCLVSVNAFSQTEYRNFSEISNALKQIQSKHPSNAKLQSLTKTIGFYINSGQVASPEHAKCDRRGEKS